MLKNIAQLAIGLESVEGTAETLLAADCIRADNIEFTPSVEMGRRHYKTTHLSPKASVPGKRMAQISFDVDLAGAASAGAAPEWADAIKACGFDETIVADTSVAYNPTHGTESATIWYLIDGKIYKSWGARGNVSLELVNGAPGILHFVFSSADWSEQDGALLSPTLSSVSPPAFLGASLTIDSYAAEISSVNVDMGNVLAQRPDANASSGVKAYVVTDRDPTLTFDPSNVLAASEDFFGNWRSGALMAFAASIGSTAGNTIAIAAPKVQYQDVKLADRDNWSSLEIQALLTANAGDDEFIITIT